MITPTQMRAARAMLDVSQGHVSEYLGIAANTLSKIESGQSDVSVSRNTDIQRFYEREGIEFTENDGVQRNSGGVITFKGRSGFLDFLDDVYETVKDGGEIFVNNVDEKKFLEWAGDVTQNHLERMNKIENLSSKILVQEGDHNQPAKYAEYAYLPRESFGSIPLYLYGNKTAFIVFSEDDVEIFLIQHAAISKYSRDRFLVQWKNLGAKVEQS